MSFSTVLSLAALLSLARAHGAILNAQGIGGSPSSVGFAVEDGIARNCTTISPCQLDATIIRDAEITANIVNMCGRTELAGNIDVGEETEKALAAKAVTQVQSGSKITVTIHQVNADGAGPYVCDLDETSNTGGVLLTQNLTVENNVPGVNGFSDAKAQDFNITVTMPDKFTCTGASTGDVCTVRCRNTALAGPFGGCFAVQQIDTKPVTNTPSSIKTAQQLDAVLAQIEQNKKDLAAAVGANQIAGSESSQQNAAAVSALLGQNPDITAAPPAATATPATGGAQRGGGAGNGNGNGNGNGRAGQGNGRAGQGGNTNNAARPGQGQGRGNGNAQQGNGKTTLVGPQQRRRFTGALQRAKRYVVEGLDFTDNES